MTRAGLFFIDFFIAVFMTFVAWAARGRNTLANKQSHVKDRSHDERLMVCVVLSLGLGCESGAPSFQTRSQVPSSGALRQRPEDQRLETLCSIVLAMRQQVGGRHVSAARGAGGERAGACVCKTQGATSRVL